MSVNEVTGSRKIVHGEVLRPKPNSLSHCTNIHYRIGTNKGNGEGEEGTEGRGETKRDLEYMRKRGRESRREESWRRERGREGKVEATEIFCF